MFSREWSFYIPTTKVFPLECFAVYGNTSNQLVYMYLLINAQHILLSLQRLVTIYKSGKDISLDDEQTLKTPATPLQANGKSPSPSTKHFHTLPHPPKNKSQLKETSV